MLKSLLEVRKPRADRPKKTSSQPAADATYLRPFGDILPMRSIIQKPVKAEQPTEQVTQQELEAAMQDDAMEELKPSDVIAASNVVKGDHEQDQHE